MTLSDLCCTAKPWSIHMANIKALFQEFYSQGDREKRMGLQPLKMMDRDFDHELPDIQVTYTIKVTVQYRRWVPV